MARLAILAFAVPLAMGWVVGRADADGGEPLARRQAIALFDGAKAAMARGDFASACSMLAKSESLDAQIGTMMNLAYCYEHIGRTASAWSLWAAAAQEAEVRGQAARAAFARGRADELEPTLFRVVVRMDPQGEAVATAVSIDGVAVTTLGAPTPVDPGEHELRAQAPGRRPWSTPFSATSRDGLPLTVPDLDPGPAEGPQSPRPKGAETGEGAPRSTAFAASREGARGGPTPISWALGGVGVGALGVGVGFGIAAMVNSRKSYDSGNCVANACNRAGADDRLRARSDADSADVAFAVGGGALIAAAIAWATSRRSSPSSVSAVVVPTLSPHSSSLSLVRSW